MDMVEQYNVHWVELDPTKGGEMAKTRPCVIVSPNELNYHLSTVIIAPITSTIRNYPFRVQCSLLGKKGEIATDQIRTIDKSRLKKQIAKLSSKEISNLQNVFNQMLCV